MICAWKNLRELRLKLFLLEIWTRFSQVLQYARLELRFLLAQARAGSAIGSSARGVGEIIGFRIVRKRDEVF